MNESNYFSDTCRLCLTKSPQNIDIFSEECDKSNIQAKIQLMFSVSVHPEEDLPRTICQECLNTVDFISTYKLNVENAQRTIMSLLSEFAKSVKCDEGQVMNFHVEPHEENYSKQHEENCVNTHEGNYSKQHEENFVNTHEEKCSLENSDDNCEMSDTSETSNICNEIGDLEESDSKFIKLEQSGNVESEPNSNSNDYSGNEDNDSLIPANQTFQYVGVQQIEDTYSQNENSVESSDSDDSSKNIKGKKGDKRKRKTSKKNESGNKRAENKTDKQPAWTSSMEEEVLNFYQFTCELCSDKQLFENFVLLCRHYRTDHACDGYLKCCKRKMYCRSHLYQHMILHTRPEMYKCPECDKQLCGPINLKQHIQIFHLPKTELPFRCSVCARGFTTKTAVENHEKSQHFLSHEEKFAHECDICGKRFASVAGVSEHKKQVHEQFRPLLCDICAKSFPNQSRLRKHMATHSGSENIKCPHCDQRLKNYGRLQVHLKRHQGVIHSCEHCEKTYPTRRLLQRHRKTHSDERPHECSMCGKRYRESSHLKMHFNQHTGAMPFSCQWCPKRFSASGPFYTHRKRVHPEELARANEASLST